MIPFSVNKVNLIWSFIKSQYTESQSKRRLKLESLLSGKNSKTLCLSNPYSFKQPYGEYIVPSLTSSENPDSSWKFCVVWAWRTVRGFVPFNPATSFILPVVFFVVAVSVIISFVTCLLTYKSQCLIPEMKTL